MSVLAERSARFLVATFIAVGALLMTGCEQTAHARPVPAKKTTSNAVGRGRYLVAVIGCNDCHSPKLRPDTMEPGASRLLSGHPATTPAPARPANMGEISASGDLTAWYGPWGVSYASNTTPDPVTGTGKRYPEATFIRAMRTGKKPEGTDMMPPMPWPDFAQLTDSDLHAIWSYLKTVKPVRNNVLASGAQAAH